MINHPVNFQIESCSTESHSLIKASSGEVVVGRLYANYYHYYWSGDLDELVIWDEALSDQDIMMIYRLLFITLTISCYIYFNDIILSNKVK